MMISDLLQNASRGAMLALSPTERWSAARQLSDGPSSYGSHPGFLLAATAALAVLIGLLWWISHRRRSERQSLTRELFAENAVRRGLSGRERQILLAIVIRSGLGRSHDIFTTVDAFDRGAAKLLAECARTRTDDENERLKTEVACLREKLGFRALRTGGGMGASRRPSSRDIPVARVVEMTRRRRHISVPVRGEVVRNDDLELAVELHEPVETRAGDLWRVRYAFGVYVWEFDTTAVTCNERRLVLNHADDVRFVNRRRFPRVAVAMPALVTRFPFARKDSFVARPMGPDACREGDGGRPALHAPAFVHGTVTELAGPGLRIEVPMRVGPGERVLVVFRPMGVARAGSGGESAIDEAHVIEDVGLVRHCRAAGAGVSIAVELSGLTETEIDELVRMTNAIASRASAEKTVGDAPAQAATLATVETAGLVQGV